MPDRMDGLRPGRSGRGKPINRDKWPPTGAQRVWLAYCDKVHQENGFPGSPAHPVRRKLNIEPAAAACCDGERLDHEPQMRAATNKWSYALPPGRSPSHHDRWLMPPGSRADIGAQSYAPP